MSEVTFEQVVSQVNALSSADRARLRDYLYTQIRKDEAVEAARQREAEMHVLVQRAQPDTSGNGCQ